MRPMAVTGSAIRSESGRRERRFALLDTQFTTEHLKRFGAVDVARRKYEQLLEQALEGSARFYP